MINNRTIAALAIVSVAALAEMSSAFVPAANRISLKKTSIARASSASDLQERPYFADIEEPKVEQKETISSTPLTTPTRKAPAKRPPGPHSKTGVFSPVVLAAKQVMGNEELNKIRGKVIGLHSEVIGSFVETSGSEFGQHVLKQLFQFADKNKNGEIEPQELDEALQSLGFKFLKEKQMKGIFDRADADHNGSIDLEEWMKAAPKTLRTNLIKLAKQNGGEMGLLS